MKKKVIFIINSMDIGGAEMILSQILPYLKKKYDVRVVTLKDINSLNVSIHPLLKIKKHPVIFFPIYFFKIMKIKFSERPYKVISFLEYSNFLNILTSINPVIFFCTNLSYFSYFRGIRGQIYKLLIIFLYPFAKKIIVNSQQNKIDLGRKIFFDINKLDVIYNPLDVDKIQKLSLENIDPEISMKLKNKTVFVTLGRLDRCKRVDVLVKGFYNLSLENKNLVLIIIGSGPEQDNIKDLISKLSLEDNVFLLGKQNNAIKYLKQANYFIYNSRVEGFPSVLLEATALGLPIITVDFKSGARELIDPELNFDEVINYPYYGPNGVLLGIDNFEQDILKVNLNRLTQKQKGMDKFLLNNVVRGWEQLIN
ncbi:MAG: glycosyltransferase [Oligoflexia bacterium]|nr:glycosyltransferase [Oligoflexia bacterium]